MSLTIQIPDSIIRFIVPIPTSTNRLHASTRTGRKYTAEDYAAWQDEAGKEILAQRAKMSPKRLPDAAPYGFILGLHPDDRADIDNRVKASLDLLRRMQVTGDDRLCRLQVAGLSSLVSPGRAALGVWRFDTTPIFPI